MFTANNGDDGVTGIRGLTRGLATLLKVTKSLLVVKVRRHVRHLVAIKSMGCDTFPSVL